MPLPESMFDLASGSSDSAQQLRYWSRYATNSNQKSAMVRAAELIEAMREQLEQVVEPASRATKCTKDISGEIYRRLAAGESLRRICNSEHLPSSRTVFRWIRDNEQFREQFEIAREEWARSKT